MNVRQHRFAQEVAALRSPAEAYCIAMDKPLSQASIPSVQTMASRWLKKVEIEAEISRIRLEAEKQAGGAVLTVLEKRLKLAQVFRSGRHVTVHSREKEGGQMELFEMEERVDFALVLKAAELDSKLADDFGETKRNQAEANALSVEARAMASLRKRRSA